MEHDARTRGKALAMLATGSSVSAVSRELGVSRSAIRAWRTAAGMPALTSDHAAKLEETAGLMFDYLHEGLLTMAAIAKFQRDEGWLRAQSAADVGMMSGILTDKIFRLLSALQPADRDWPATGVTSIQGDTDG